MRKEQLVLLLVWGGCAVAILLFVRRSNWRQFAFSYLLSQNFTWISVILFTKFGIFTYPVREFPKATQMGFTMPYMLYPVLSGLYVLFRPRLPFFLELIYMLPWSLGVTLLHYLLGRYTRLVSYSSSHSILVWVTISLIFSAVSLMERRFFRDQALSRSEERLV